MSEAFDPAIFDFYAELPQQGPGRNSETLRVLSCISDRLPPRPTIADLGCGTGRATLALASALPDAAITAVDFSEVFCRRLRNEVARRGLADRVQVVEADMAAPPTARGSLDLLWSEGAAYNIGFENALSLWRPLLRSEGLAVISECTWLSEKRPAEVATFWATAYPAMGTRDENVSRATSAGYEIIDTHTLPAAAWDDYYDPITEAIEAGRVAQLGPAFIAELEQERAIFAASEGSYGYVFYILKPRRAG
ncbi:class I SAM-dependent methyltransferase [Hyphomicrobium sp. CS1BSMeth3]|uniref:SAM-dependent methyltransferase n=1 Tax=Hyphomicrobium sp. CS1BSMeth3 TaxID=1892844 RepID=UPI00093012C8|nr:class I SAM-dependent methyltransferase [Hyphomicrobium sp. CS1BSMeth3]